jgi:hypothetical protein
MKYPIFGLIGVVLTEDSSKSPCIGLIHKVTGKEIKLMGDPYTSVHVLHPVDLDTRPKVEFDLHQDLEQAKLDAAALFGMPLEASREKGGEAVLVDQEEYAVETAIDLIDGEMRGYVKLHPYEPNDRGHVLDMIGKRKEYVRLLRHRDELMEDLGSRI